MTKFYPEGEGIARKIQRGIRGESNIDVRED